MKKEMTNDMTVGSPAKLIIQFMIPMCLEMCSSSFTILRIPSLQGSFWVSMLWQQSEVPVH